jgi:hypothetical protein
VTDEDLALYEQEVAELTELLQTEWADLRAALTSAGVILDGCLLAAHVEDENDGSEHGVLVRAPDDILRFTVDGASVTTERVTVADIRAEFPPVDAALRLL